MNDGIEGPKLIDLIGNVPCLGNAGEIPQRLPILLREVCSEPHPLVVGFEHAIPRCGPVQPKAVRP